jgi:4-azaleucine resistance transporter AzlC
MRFAHTLRTHSVPKEPNMTHRAEFVAAFKASVPVMMGYLVLGFAFGLLLGSQGLEWPWALAMSILIYAGALQFAAVGFFAAKLGLVQIAIASLFINIRQAFYGLSLLKKFARTGWRKPYLIHALTDETYALLTTIPVPEGLSEKHYAFYLSALNHSYWVTGSVLGALVGGSVSFDTRGVAFSLTALFVVLAMENYKSRRQILPFVIGAVASAVSMMVLSSANMLIGAIVLALVMLFALRTRIERGSDDA